MTSMTMTSTRPPPEDAHLPQPPVFRAIHKHYQKFPIESFPSDPNILDFNNLSDFHKSKLKVVGKIPKAHLERICHRFENWVNWTEEYANDGDDRGSDLLEKKGGKVITEVMKSTNNNETIILEEGDKPIYEHDFLPGLLLLPSLLPTPTQLALLSSLWLRELSNPQHNTNLHLHYTIPYPSQHGSPSFFHLSDPDSLSLTPKDPLVHKPLSIPTFLAKKLHWMTVGGQYDWARRAYPEIDQDSQDHPVSSLIPFPSDIFYLINSLFPDINPQAGIANLYTPGDRLSPHRDVSEASSAPLASLSIGIDALFLCGLDSSLSDEPSNEKEDEVLIFRMRAGDTILMGKKARWAWHSVPRVLPRNSASSSAIGKDDHTLMDEIEEWPGNEPGVHEIWKGWMKNRRCNFNVRQMWD